MQISLSRTQARPVIIAVKQEQEFLYNLPGAGPLEEHVERPPRDDPVAEEVADPRLL